MTITFLHELKKEHLPEIKKILISTEKFNTEEMDIAMELVIDRLDKKEKSDYQFILATIDHAVVGYACFGKIAGTESSFDLYWIVVDADVQNKKIGKQLLTEVEKEASRQGGKRLIAETASKAAYALTRLFYERNHFRKEAIIKDYYADDDDKVIYVKDIIED